MTIKDDTAASGKGGGGSGLVDQLFAPATPVDEQVAMAAIEPAKIPAYPAPMVVVPTTSIATATATAGYSSTTTSSAVGAVGAAPPNAPPGGRWVDRKFIGTTTWSITTIVSVCTCFFICLPCGFWGLLCPCDKKRVYISQGKAYDESGQVVGPA
jgi:hypothetical protein